MADERERQSEGPHPVLSAEEGADRVHRRHRQSKDCSSSAERTDEAETPTYTCENCGSHDFVLVHIHTARRRIRRTLACTCGAERFAAIQELVEWQRCTERAPLDEEHRTDKSEVDYDKECEEQEFEVYCGDCHENASEWQWESDTVGDWETDEESQVFQVRCADCNHEIEFGWSHPDRGGRVWPCESSDHNPWLSWPEPRFIAAWKRRGWLRPR